MSLTIEPIYALLMTSILSFYPDNTKISICNYDLIIRNPSIYQGIVRWSYGESRSEIIDLLKSIRIGLLIFIKYEYQLEHILFTVYNGLNKLKLCYIQDLQIKKNIESVETIVKKMYEQKEVIVTEQKYNKCFEQLWTSKELLHINSILNEINKLFSLQTIKLPEKVTLRKKLLDYLCLFLNLKNTSFKQKHLKQYPQLINKKIKLK